MQSSRPRLAVFEAVLRSPFAMMPLWIAFGVVLYTFGWSELFDFLRADTLVFLSVAVVLFLLISVAMPTPVLGGRTVPLDPWAVCIIAVYFIGAYIKNGGVPIIQIASGGDYDIYGFGIDGLHIFMLCFTGYYGVRAWAAFLSRGGVGNLVVLAGVATLLISIGNRSALSFLAFACAFMFVRRRQLSGRVWLTVAVLGLLFAFGFGVFGDIRLSYQIAQATGAPGSMEAVLQLSHATDGFRESGIAPTWLWAYTYFVSPLANLNAAFALSDGAPCGQSCNLAAVALYDLTPDVLGVRLAESFGVSDIAKSDFLVAPNLTASTAFGTAVAGAGWLGGTIVLGGLAALGTLCVALLRRSPAREEGLAILSTIIFFSFFENMVAYTALLGQLTFPIALGLFALFRERASARVGVLT